MSWTKAAPAVFDAISAENEPKAIDVSQTIPADSRAPVDAGWLARAQHDLRVLRAAADALEARVERLRSDYGLLYTVEERSGGIRAAVQCTLRTENSHERVTPARGTCANESAENKQNRVEVGIRSTDVQPKTAMNEFNAPVVLNTPRAENGSHAVVVRGARPKTSQKLSECFMAENKPNRVSHGVAAAENKPKRLGLGAP